MQNNPTIEQLRQKVATALPTHLNMTRSQRGDDAPTFGAPYWENTGEPVREIEWLGIMAWIEAGLSEEAARFYYPMLALIRGRDYRMTHKTCDLNTASATAPQRMLAYWLLDQQRSIPPYPETPKTSSPA